MNSVWADIDTTANQYYKSERELAFDLAAALNFEICALAAAGCKYIQVDEPLFVRKVDDALAYGVQVYKTLPPWIKEKREPETDAEIMAAHRKKIAAQNRRNNRRGVVGWFS